MAIKRKPLSARVVATLKAKAKKSKLFNLADLKASYRRGQGAFLSSGSRPRIQINECMGYGEKRRKKELQQADRSRGRSGTFELKSYNFQRRFK